MATKHLIVVDDATNVVVGFQRQPADRPLPPKPEGRTLVEVSPELESQVKRLRHENSGPARWEWDGNRVVERPDPRFTVRVTQNPKPASVGEPVTITLEVLNAGGQVRAGLNRTGVPIQYLDPDRRLRRGRVNIVNGVATRTFTSQSSGEMEMISDDANVRFVGDNPILIDEDW